MSDINNKRTKWLHVRLSETELRQFTAAQKKTTTRKRSEYARAILLGKPIVATYRNQSMDDLMTELIRLRRELNSIGNNFNQLVKRLHSATQTVAIVDLLHGYEEDKNTLLKHIAVIQMFIEKNEQSW